jgi:hypothetical protein
LRLAAGDEHAGVRVATFVLPADPDVNTSATAIPAG